jgi:hypothetical protein
MTFNIRNTEIASFVRDGQTYGAFKLAHVYAGAIDFPEYTNDKGKATVKRDKKGDIIRTPEDGIRLLFKYRTTGKTWGGTFEDIDGAVASKGMVSVELKMPKEVTSNSKVAKLLVLLGLHDAPDSEVAEDEIAVEEDTLSDDDLTEDNDEETGEVQELTLDTLKAILNSFEGRIFKAPYSKTERGYTLLNTDFSLWELVTPAK